MRINFPQEPSTHKWPERSCWPVRRLSFTPPVAFGRLDRNVHHGRPRWRVLHVEWLSAAASPAGSAWFNICRFWVTQARGNHRPAEAGFWLEGCLVREAASLLGSGSLGLQRPEAQQGEPMRMALADHQFARAFAVTLGTLAAHETPMVQEELQQAQIRTAQMAAQREVGAQPRIEVLHQRTAARCLCQGSAHRLEQRVELTAHLCSKPVPPLPVGA